MIKIFVCENETLELDKYKNYFKRYELENNGEFAVSYYQNGDDLISTYKKGRADAIFMDIDMPGTNGLETSKLIRKIDENVTIIFVTNLSSFALDSYKVHALDFLLKPLSYNDFKVEIDKIIRSSIAQNNRVLLINYKSNLYKIELNDILYIETLRHDLTVHTINDEITFRSTLKEIEDKLNSSFSRCNNCYIVNLKYVKTIEKENCLLTNGTSLQISRNKKKKFLDDFTKYLNVDF